MSPRHRIAMIGLGMGATPHAQSLIDLKLRVEVAAAYTRSPARAAAFAERFDFPLTHDLAAIERDASIGCVLIAAPPNAHLELVERFAAVGKHILLEKPLEVSPARCEALVAACARSGVRLGVVFQHRFRVGARRLAELLAQGSLGRIAVANVSVPWWRAQSYYDQPGRGTLERDGGGVLITQAIHTLDLFLSLAGTVTEVTAFAGTTPLHQMETEDLVAAAWRLQSGAIGTLMATTALYPGLGERIELAGDAGSAILADGELVVHTHDSRSERAGQSGGGGGGADPMAFSNHAHRAVLADFLDAVEAGRDPMASGHAGLLVHRLIEALLESARTHRSVRPRES